MKRKFAVLVAMIMCLSAVPMSGVTAVAADNGDTDILEELIITEMPAFNEESFFVVVGTYGNSYTQLRYFYPKSNGGYGADKVVLNNADESLSYGDVLIAEGDVELTKVYDFQDNPAYAMSYYYSLNEDIILDNVGNCSELMEQKELSISDKNYDGSGHWSINLIDEAGNKYYYGLNILASTLGIDIVYDSEIGDTYSFAFNNGNIVIPLASLNEEVLPGDVNADGKFNVADVVLLQKWLLSAPDVTIPDWKTADLCEDGVINVFDICVMKQKLISEKNSTNKVYVQNTEELKNALENAEAGDEIILAEGEYIYSGSTSKGYMFKSSADGTEENPILIHSENPDKPAVISGLSTSENYAFSILGDWWEIRDLTNIGKNSPTC